LVVGPFLTIRDLVAHYPCCPDAFAAVQQEVGRHWLLLCGHRR